MECLRDDYRDNDGDEEEVKGDPPVFYTQKWLNDTFRGYSSWVSLEEDGHTGWGTINGLIRALQIYLGITVDGDFGDGTKNAFIDRFSATGGELHPTIGVYDWIYGIVVGALWCKGYYGAEQYEITCTMDQRGCNSIVELKADAGLGGNSSISAAWMKELLSMDQFKLLSAYGGRAEIRTIQQYLNVNYGYYVGIIPCDGVYQRQMNTALIKMLQAIEGFTGNDVDGLLGNNTKNLLPQVSAEHHPSDALRLLVFCLICNGFSVTDTSTWTDELSQKIKAFQKKYYINATGMGDTDTWMSLLLSSGNPDRSATACDCATILDSEKATALYEAGYRYVGRYLTGYVGDGVPKALSKEEMTAIFNAGLRLFAIFQDGESYLDRYTYDSGYQDAENAIEAAAALGIPTGEIIYFAVDYDIMDVYISEKYVVGYFRAINKVMEDHGNKYKVGIYASRNVCNKIWRTYGLACSSFVGDMSTGYSGNMGFSIPDNWAFDQFKEFLFSRNNVSFPLDKDAVSGKYLGFDRFETDTSSKEDTDPDIMLDEAEGIVSRVLMDCVGSEKLSLQWSIPKVFDLGYAKITVTVKYGALFNFAQDKTDYVTYNIKDFDLEGFDATFTTDMCKSCEDDMNASLNTTLNLDGWQAAINVAKEIENGRISFGTSISPPNGLSNYIIIEKCFGAVGDLRNTLSVKIEFSINSGDDPDSDIGNFAVEYNEQTDTVVKNVAIALTVVAAVIGAAVVIASLPSIIGAIAAAILKALGAALPLFI